MTSLARNFWSATSQALARSPIVSERQLAQARFDVAYYRGVDRVRAFTGVAAAMRSGYVDPDATHIQSFAAELPDHFQRVHQSITAQDIYDDQFTRLTALYELAGEAHERLHTRGVTYRWWLHCNSRLSMLATPQNLRGKNPDYALMTAEETAAAQQRFTLKAQQALENLNAVFPQYIAMPLVESQVGLIAFNRGFVERVFPLALATASTPVDGFHMWPDALFAHDVDHVLSMVRAEREVSCAAEKRCALVCDFVSAMEQLPHRAQVRAELGFFLMHHETPRLCWDVLDGGFNGSYQSVVSNFTMRDALRHFHDPHSYNRLLPLHLRLQSSAVIERFLGQCALTVYNIAAAINHTSRHSPLLAFFGILP